MSSSTPQGRYAGRVTARTASSSSPGAFHLLRKTVHDLWPKLEPGVSALQAILKSCVDEGAPSRQADETGELTLPFDFEAATRFRVHNVHHSACVERRKQAMVGLGHAISDKGKAAKQEQSNAALTLDPKSRVSWQTTESQLAEDYVSVGNCYLEVVRQGSRPNGKIMGVHYIPANTVRIVLEDDRGINRHFRILNGASRANIGGGRTDRGDLAMALFGDLGDFRRRANEGRLLEVTGSKDDGFSELIHIPQPATGLDRWYGFPDWLAATGYVELTQAVLQQQFDFFSNRGVPEFLLFLLGGRVDDQMWDSMSSAFDSYVGFGNQHKSSMFNLPDPSITVQLEKLALEGIANGTFFKDMMEVLSTTIVSAHGVPPSMAGILIPGKMGAANELANIVTFFQLLVAGPAQVHIQNVLGCTLGNSRHNQGLEIPAASDDEGPSPDAGRRLRFADFKFNTVVSALGETMQDMQPADTMGRMKDPLPNALANGRDLNDGLLRDGRDTDEEIERSMKIQQLLKDENLMASLFAAAAEAQVRRNGES